MLRSRKFGIYLVIISPFLLPLIIRSEFMIYLLTEIYIMALFSMSFNILLGYTGLLPFGHAAFFGLGAYSCILLIKRASFDPILAFLLALVIPLFFALVMGYFCIQRMKVYFALLSLAFGQIVYTAIFKWYDFTGGDTGIYGVPRPHIFGIDLESSTAFYYFSLSIITVTFALIYIIVHSPFGAILRAIRENPERAEYLAINVKLYQLLSFVLAAFFAAEAGALYAFFQRYAVPTFAGIPKTVEAMVMTILGGTYYFVGPIFGTIIVTVLDKIITTYTEYWPFILGSIILVLALFLPGGIVGLADSLIRKRAR